MRPELQQRNAAFKRGSAYAERYCLLIALTYYLEHVGPESGAKFSQWIQVGGARGGGGGAEGGVQDGR